MSDASGQGNNTHATGGISRRGMLAASAGVIAAASFPTGMVFGRGLGAHVAGSDTLRVGLIGCGGRGTGAAMDNLNASARVKVVALADVMPERIEAARKGLIEQFKDRADVSQERCYSGFDAYKKLLASEVDLVILATPPHFRPIHLAAAVEAGKHVFMEKPVAVDPQGVRSVIASGEVASKKNLGIVAGTQRRHQKCYLEAMQRLKDEAIGQVVEASCYWNQGGLWMNPRQAEWSDMEWQLRNWLYFTWLSGDHIVEQHVHNIDVMNWGIGAHPVKCWGMGGRQVRTDPAYGHVYDHFAIEFEYPGGVVGHSYCRQIDGTTPRVSELFVGSSGRLYTQPGGGRIDGPRPWQFKGKDNNPYQDEHVDLIKSIESGKPLNEAKRIAESTLTAIMGRLAAYTGQEITWDQAMNMKFRLGPTEYAMGPLPVDPVAVPGKTKFE